MKRIILLVLIILALAGLVLYLTNRLSPDTWDELKQGFCDMRGGEMVTKACGYGGCTYQCVYKYPDAGKACVSSSQCKGKCMVADDRLPAPSMVTLSDQSKAYTGSLGECEHLGDKIYDCSVIQPKGQCQQRQLANCENGWELNSGILTPMLTECRL